MARPTNLNTRSCVSCRADGLEAPGLPALVLPVNVRRWVLADNMLVVLQQVLSLLAVAEIPRFRSITISLIPVFSRWIFL